MVIGERAAQCIAYVIREGCNARHLRDGGFHCQFLLWVGARTGTPPLTIDEYPRVDGIELTADVVHGLYVMDAHEVYTEAVDMVLVHPVFHRLQHEFVHQRLLACRLVAAARPVGGGAVGIVAVVSLGECTLEVAVGKVEGMVVNHVKNHSDPRFVQCLYHLLELHDAA